MLDQFGRALNRVVDSLGIVAGLPEREEMMHSLFPSNIEKTQLRWKSPCNGEASR
ncbi:MAG: hypothetical protein R3A47_06840 [Polyangiales bacterium]